MKKLILILIILITNYSYSQEFFGSYFSKKPVVSLDNYNWYYADGNTCSQLAGVNAKNVNGFGAVIYEYGWVASQTNTLPSLENYSKISYSTTPVIKNETTFAGNGTGCIFGAGSWYLRLYVKTMYGVGYSESFYGYTPGSSNLPPTVTTNDITNIGLTTATSGGNVTDEGTATVTERGIVVNTTGEPSLTSYLFKFTASTGGAGSYTTNLTGLDQDDTYYVRAYAINSVGTSYGNEINFRTLAQLQPTLTTRYLTDVQFTLATSGGIITFDGNAPIVQKGICWNTTGSPNPASPNYYTNDGSGTSSYYSYMTGLNPGTTYYVRAYARNAYTYSWGTLFVLGYGQEEVFTTPSSGTLADLQTNAVTNITATTVTLNGSVIDENGSSVTDRGFVYSTSKYPTLSDNVVGAGYGSGNFSSNINSLTCGTTYYVRTYAINGAGIAYGNQVSFTTLCTLPTFIAASCNAVTSYSIDVSATILSDGGCPVTSRGFQYSTDASFTTILGSITASGTGVGQYYATISGLNCGVHYYFRPWATNSTGTYYATSLIGTGCTTISHPEYSPTSGLFYAIKSSTCFSRDFTSTFASACNAKAEYFNISCDASLVGRIYRTHSGTLSVGDKLYYFDGCEVNTTGYEMNNNYDIVYILNGVIQSITPCP